MSYYKINWDEINNLPIKDVAQHLGLKIRGERFCCNYKKRSNFDGYINEKKNLWNCFHCAKGGNVTHLVAHIREYDNSPAAIQRAAIYIGQVFGVGLTEEKDETQENSEITLPSLHINKSTLALLGLEKNPLLQANFYVSVPNVPSNRFANDEEMFEDYSFAEERSGDFRADIELSKSAAVKILLERCHECFSSLEEEKELAFSFCKNENEKNLVCNTFDKKFEQLAALVDQLEVIQLYLVPLEGKEEITYEDYGEIFK